VSKLIKYQTKGYKDLFFNLIQQILKTQKGFAITLSKT